MGLTKENASGLAHTARGKLLLSGTMEAALRSAGHDPAAIADALRVAGGDMLPSKKETNVAIDFFVFGLLVAEEAKQ